VLGGNERPRTGPRETKVDLVDVADDDDVVVVPFVPLQEVVSFQASKSRG